METKINSETAFFTLDGQEFEVKKVETRKLTSEQLSFIYEVSPEIKDIFLFNGQDFFYNLNTYFGLVEKWEQFLISEARKRGFVSGCHFSDGIKIIYMPSGRMKLLTLSKLVTDCRNPTVIYNNGKWCDVIKKEAGEAVMNKCKCRELIGKLTWQLLNPSGFNTLDRDGIIFIRDILNEKLNEKP